MQNVMIIGQTPPPQNGSSKMAVMLGKTLDQIGYEVTIVSKEFSKATGEIGKGYLAKALKIPRLLRKINLAFRKKPKVVILFLTSRWPSVLLDLVIFWICYRKKSRMVLYLHTIGFKKLASKNLLLRKLVSKAFLRASAVVVLGKAMQSDIAELGACSNIIIIPNCVEDHAERFPPVPNIKSRHSLTFVSNLVPSKGLDTFIQVFTALAESNPSIRANVIGEQIYDGQLLEIKASIRNPSTLERIKFWGSQNSKFILEKFGESFALLYPSLEDAQPLVVLEAMSSGLPVVATKVGTLPEVLGSLPNLTFEPNDIEGMKLACQNLLDNSDLWEIVSSQEKDLSFRYYSVNAYKENWSKLMSSIFENKRT